MASREVVEVVITQEGTRVTPAVHAVALGLVIGLQDVTDDELVEAVIRAEKLGLSITIRRDAQSISERLAGVVRL